MSISRLYALFIGTALWSILCSFQTPDLVEGLKRWEQAKQQHQVDSLLHYHHQLSDQWETDEQRRSFDSRLLDYVVGNPRLAADQQFQYIQQYAPSTAWYHAYQAHWHQWQDQQDSAHHYWNLLTPDLEDGLPYCYVASRWALLLAERGRFSEATTYLQYATNSALPAKIQQPFYPYYIKTHRLMGQGVRAAQLTREYLQLLEQQPILDSIAIAYAYDQWTSIHLMQQRYYQATLSAGNALNYMADRPGHAYELGRFWYRWSWAHAALEHTASATLLYLQRAEELLLQASNHPQQQEALIEIYDLMANQWIRQPQLDSAQYYLQRVEALQRQTPHQLLQTTITWAHYYEAAGELAQAEQTLQKAVQQTKEEDGATSSRTAQRLLALGQWYQRQQRYANAERALRQAYLAQVLEIPKPSTIGPQTTQVMQVSLALSIGMERMDVMLARYRQSRYALSASAITAQLQLNIALLEAWEKQDARWSPTWSTIVQRLGQQVLDWYWEGQHGGTTTLPIETVFQWAEQVRHTRFLTDLLGRNQCLPGMDTSRIQEWQQYSRELDDYLRIDQMAHIKGDSALLRWTQQQLPRTRKAYASALDATTRRHPRYRRWYHPMGSTIIDLSRIQAQLRIDDAAMIQYVETPEVLYQWVVTPDTLLLRRIVWEEYRSTILKYQQHFTSPRLRQNARSGGFQDYCRTAHELYYRLVYHEVLREQRRWIVVADGLLQTLPFETLLMDIPMDAIHEVKYEQLAYVLQAHQVSYQHSCQHWWDTRTDSAVAPNQAVMAMATSYEQPVEQGTDLYRTWRKLVMNQGFVLPLMDSLDRRFAGDFYTNRYATEYLLKQQSPNHGILHWGLYALVSQHTHGEAALLFMPDRYREDHLLQLDELYGMSLNADILVLTNWWTDYSLQEVRQAWTAWAGGTYYAGSRALMMPLWTQDSSSTIVLDDYYNNLHEGMAKDEALRQAKLTYLKNTKGIAAHPAQWAGYRMLGNYESIEIAAPVAYSWWFVIPIALIGLLGWWSLRALRQRR